MQLKYRDGSIKETGAGQERMLRFLYGNVFGRILLRPLLFSPISKLAGWLLNRRISRPMIPRFIRSNHIDMDQYEPVQYANFNQFFSRKIKPEARPVDMAPGHLISPADSKLSVLPITPEASFTIKHTPYTVASLLKDEALAAQYAGGQLLIFRLSVEDYHRYHYPVDGTRGAFVHIKGRFHTVNPIANDHYPIYKENTREYCQIQSADFGPVVMMEVGALLVGKIVNHEGDSQVKRGQEKGMFLYGGSTVVMLLKKDAAVIDSDLLENSAAGFETIVKYGERIGQKP